MAHKTLLTFIALIIAGALPASAFARAGAVTFSVGSVTAVDANGYPRELAKGAAIVSGDTVITAANGYVQMEFADGGVVSLQSQSRLRIDEYEYTGRADGSEKGFFNLIKGGLRVVTGLIGKVNRDRYRLKTPVATVGIRGTHFVLRLCDTDCRVDNAALADGLYASVLEGEIELTNTLGKFNLDRGSSAFVANANASPVPIKMPPALAPAPVQRPGANRPTNQSPTNQPPPGPGTLKPPPLPAMVPGALPPPGSIGQGALVPIDTQDPISGPGELFVQPPLGTEIKVRGMGFIMADGAGNKPVRTFSLDELGRMTAFGSAPEIFLGTNAIVDAGNTGLIGWGRWTGGQTYSDPAGQNATFRSPSSLHYVVTTDLTPRDFFATAPTLTYVLRAASAATAANGTAGAGVTSGTIVINAGPTPLIGIDLSVGHNGNAYAVSTGAVPIPMAIDQALFTGAASATTANSCRPACVTNINGVVAGASASEVGLIYEILDAVAIHGTAVFVQ